MRVLNTMIYQKNNPRSGNAAAKQRTRKRCLPKENSKSLNFFDIQPDPLPKMVANDSSAVVASIPALKLGPKAVLVSKASFVIFPGAMLEI